MAQETKAKYDKYFEGIDKDKDGLVSGEEARGLFMASNLSSGILAHVWLALLDNCLSFVYPLPLQSDHMVIYECILFRVSVTHVSGV